MITTQLRRAVENVAGVEFDFLLASDLPGVIGGWRSLGRRGYVAVVNPHSVMTSKRDPEMQQAIAQATVTLPDGVGIVMAARMLGYGRQHRCTGPALMLEVCDSGRDHGLTHFFYGGDAGIADRLAERLTEKYPGLKVAGTYCPPFGEITSDQDEAIVAQINASKADVVWVGLGAPKQEKWMAAHLGRIRASAMIGVGAAFDFHSGNVEWAPHLFRRFGMEWAHRLATNPRRMWRRNLDSPLFLAHVTRQALARQLSRLIVAPGRRSGTVVDQKGLPSQVRAKSI